MNDCACVQMEDDYFALEELLAENESFRCGKWALRTVVRTNSDHLILDMLRRTTCCNIGSHWLSALGESGFSRAVINGFQGRVSFGFLHIDNRPFSPSAQAYLARLRREMEK